MVLEVHKENVGQPQNDSHRAHRLAWQKTHIVQSEVCRLLLQTVPINASANKYELDLWEGLTAQVGSDKNRIEGLAGSHCSGEHHIEATGESETGGEFRSRCGWQDRGLVAPVIDQINLFRRNSPANQLLLEPRGKHNDMSGATVDEPAPF